MTHALPPGSRSRLAATLAFIRDPMAAHRRLLHRHGDPFSTFIGPVPVVVTAKPGGIRDVFAAPAASFCTSGLSLEAIGGAQSVMTLAGTGHEAMRRLLNASMAERRTDLSGRIILDIARRHVATWPRGRPVAATPLLTRISLEAILRAVCGIAEALRIERFAAAFDALNRSIGVLITLVPATRRDLGRWSPWGRFLRARMALTRLFDEEIAAARVASPGRTDALATLVAMTGPDGKPALDDAAIHDNLIALLLAGYLTTASALAWAIHWGWSTPGVLARLKAELAAFARSGTPEDALGSPYLEAVCRETLRIRPVAAIVTRSLATPLTVSGHPIPAGATLAVSIDLAHHDPGNFPDPERFNPERFLNGRVSTTRFLPFGGGRRHCLGAALAMEEMRLVLAVMATTLDLRLVDPRTPRRQFVSGALLPKGGVKIVVDAVR